jgi:uncharacterized membrane protein YccC
MGDEVEVRREDQDKINKFSRLHQHELSIEEELKGKNVGDRLRNTPRPAQLTDCVRAEGKRRTRRHHGRAGARRRGRYRAVSCTATDGHYTAHTHTHQKNTG